MTFGNFQFQPQFKAKVFKPEDYAQVNQQTQNVMNNQQKMQLEQFLRENYLKSISDYINSGRQFNDVRRIRREDEDPFVNPNFLTRVRKNPFFQNNISYNLLNSPNLGNKVARMSKRKKLKKSKSKYFD